MPVYVLVWRSITHIQHLAQITSLILRTKTPRHFVFFFNVEPRVEAHFSMSYSYTIFIIYKLRAFGEVVDQNRRQMSSPYLVTINTISFCSGR
jgi:hypothetical protein